MASVRRSQKGSVGICLIPLAIVQGKWSEKIYKEQTKLKDDRVNVANEALGGIKLVKFYSWENPFEQKIDSIRQTELKTMRKLKLVRDCGWLLWEIGPFLMEWILFEAENHFCLKTFLSCYSFESFQILETIILLAIKITQKTKNNSTRLIISSQRIEIHWKT